MSGEFRAAVIEGLQQRPKRISPKFLYDDEGSRLFERICELPEYYLTRAETEILESRADEIAARASSARALLELGSGASTKTRILLRSMRDLQAYVPVDICREALETSAKRLAADFPDVEILPVNADFMRPLEAIPRSDGPDWLAFFPGSSIGNLDPGEARDLLARIAITLGAGSRMLLGVDLLKPSWELEAAYDDRAGVTALFNLNLLARMKRELEADIDLDKFAHRAKYNSREQRIEMHLSSLEDQLIRLEGDVFHFHAGETIHTENSYKYLPGQFDTLARAAGYDVERVWTDSARRFGVFLLQAT